MFPDLEARFKPWPEWLQQCNIAFNFDFHSTSNNRQSALEDRLTAPHPLIQEEKKDRNAAEYSTILLNVEEVLAKSKEKLTQTQLWYNILTEESFFEN